MASSGGLVKWFVTVTLQITTPPPPLPEPLHCWTTVTGSVEMVTTGSSQVPSPSAIGPAAPTQRVTVTVEGVVGSRVPALVR